MALAMQRARSPPRRRLAQARLRPALGVGIAQGFATIGGIGFEGRWDYGAIGTVTNLAARLCGEAKGGEILVSSRVAGAIEDMAELEDVGSSRSRGSSSPSAPSTRWG